MYSNKDYVSNDKAKLIEIIKAYPFATLFSLHNEEPIATHLPFIVDSSKNEIHSHIALHNKQADSLIHQPVLVVFQGDSSYISPSWYEKQDTVPTWNYVAVHVSGVAQKLNPLELKDSLQQLLSEHEPPTSTYTYDVVDPAYFDRLQSAILGFKLSLSKMEGIIKMSQDHSRERRERIIEHLEEMGSPVAEWMKKER
ncbi:hypothetical protein Q73_05915 [Bacillus coahuilensis m2-6]|uniref:FMN-binding negative transcriptional regulator n=1 Tax=Bacillus coahuilensis TaxID=408580 RepID=UPI00075031F0|nr:FMN-binding negative transcriptional regulator [Bacillus coahuilensis]KUP08717.1 hypothetical protein Q73_05915 [Bacillus coahuilensis m2-6]